MIDIARANLWCAVDLPGAERLEIGGCLEVLALWTDCVRKGTERHTRSFRSNPGRFANSEAYFRLLVLVTVLQRDLGIRYNSERIGDASPGFSADSRDLFLHGVLTGSRTGTCCSIPVLYVAVGRRLGYPMYLCLAKHHVFARWETSKERLNVEGTSLGLNCFPDEHYMNWPAPLTQEEFTGGDFLRCLGSEEELALFTATRGFCLLYNFGIEAALPAFEQAYKLVPGSRHYRALAAAAEQAEWENRTPGGQWKLHAFATAQERRDSQNGSVVQTKGR